MKTLSQEAWQKAFKNDENGQIIDVRSAEEYQEAHIPGAKLIDVQDPQSFMDQINQLNKTDSYYVYCNSGNRGNQACLVMEYAGFENTRNLEGGIALWKGETA